VRLSERIERALALARLDGLIAASIENAIWLSGVYNPVRRMIVERPAIVLWPASGPPALIAASVEEAFLRERSSIPDLRLYKGTIEAAVSTLFDALRNRGVATGRLGLDVGGISAPFYLELRRRLPDAEIVDATDLLDRLRAVKNEQEIALLRRAALATDRAEWSTLDAFRLGWTELDVGTRLRQALIAEGAETIAHLLLGGGARGVAAHAEPQDITLQPGEVLRFDFGGVFRGWYSDIAKTAVIGSPSPRQRELYRVVHQVLDRHIARLRPGVVVGELHKSVAHDFAQAGLEFRAPHVGHGIGLSVHEWPVLHEGSSASLEADMVLCAEIIHVEADRERYHLEEVVWVRDSGPEVVSRSRVAPAEIPIIGGLS